jgi:hypothetical protein
MNAEVVPTEEIHPPQRRVSATAVVALWIGQLALVPLVHALIPAGTDSLPPNTYNILIVAMWSVSTCALYGYIFERLGTKVFRVLVFFVIPPLLAVIVVGAPFAELFRITREFKRQNSA